MTATPPDMPSRQELERNLLSLQRKTRRIRNAVCAVYEYLVLVAGMLFGVAVVLYVLLFTSIPIALAWLVAVGCVIPLILSVCWLLARRDWVVFTFVHRRSKLRRVGLLCPACSYRLDWERYKDSMIENLVLETGRCYRCGQPVVSDPPPVPVPDPVIESPFALNDEPAPRLKRAFAGECRFSSRGYTIDLVRVAVGSVCLPTGRVIACDPLYVHEATVIKVPPTPGAFEVDLLVARATRGGETLDERIACARLRFRDKPAARFEAVYGYGVDNATGCFTDEVGANRLRSMNDEAFESFWERMRREEDEVYVDTRSWATLELDPDSGANIVVFTSGYGDGGYDVYVGLDDVGRPVSLVTDFGLLFTTQDQEKEAKRRRWKFW